VFEVSLLIGVLLALGIGVGAPFAIKVVAGPGFDQSIGVLRLLSVALVTSFLVATWSFALLSLKCFREILWANLIAAIVAIAGTLILAPGMGARGAALATVIAEAALVIAAVYLLRRARPLLSPDLGIVPKVALAAALAIGVALVVPAPSVVLAGLAGLVYTGVVLALRAVPPELFTALLRRDEA
jgi:O-antigen/teichoic acid export membrane protein